MRSKGIAAELYPDTVKMKKQMTYVDKRAIPFAILVGSNEMENNTYRVKNMETGTQEQLSLADLIVVLGN